MGRQMRVPLGRNLQFSANKSPYLRNGARWDQGYNDSLIGSCMRFQSVPKRRLPDLERPIRTLLQKRCVFRSQPQKFEDPYTISGKNAGHWL